MKNVFLLIAFLSSFFLAAQTEHRIPLSGKAVEFREIDHLKIVGYDGTELKINRGNSSSRTNDERAAGLKKISATGKQDNTGLGLSVQTIDGKVVVEQIGRGEGTITVSVPNSALVKVVQSTYHGGDLVVNDFKGELDVTMNYHQVILNNAYGPLSINTIYGGIETKFAAGPPNQDIRLHSTYANVDLTLPAATKANLRLNTSYGSMYTDFDIDIKAGSVVSSKGQPSAVDWDSDEARSPKEQDGLTGTINGGGKLVSLTATYKNVYLRKQ
ncbi:hypothetical protein QWY85_19885 [Neolewinella lacunae]|uniref:Adhesin domain-containing protein n=1 Tax=Neolewinella lacunae TaxID=1517758 RepID=A0A923PRU5_9BACT|nr:hypothetical protein [Neolewinella lacunae]MBC6996318.1 hypothetical protein [Neolewinella lacunae]MDN3636941.1 hypothetical protein [Neolewinella lacunae]